MVRSPGSLAARNSSRARARSGSPPRSRSTASRRPSTASEMRARARTAGCARPRMTRASRSRTLPGSSPSWSRRASQKAAAVRRSNSSAADSIRPRSASGSRSTSSPPVTARRTWATKSSPSGVGCWVGADKARDPHERPDPGLSRLWLVGLAAAATEGKTHAAPPRCPRTRIETAQGPLVRTRGRRECPCRAPCQQGSGRLPAARGWSRSALGRSGAAPCDRPSRWPRRPGRAGR